MPLLITPTAPLLSVAQFPITTLYVIIDGVSYSRRGLSPKTITASVGYYANEAASRTAESIAVEGLPTTFSQEASAEEANALPIFAFLEGLLRKQLEAALPAGTPIETAA